MKERWAWSMFVLFAQLLCKRDASIMDRVCRLKLIWKETKDSNKSKALCLLGTVMLLPAI